MRNIAAPFDDVQSAPKERSSCRKRAGYMRSALLFIGVPVCAAFGASAISFAKEKTASSLLQLLGATFLIVVVLTHVAETFHVFPGIGWGLPTSVGHYIDLISAITGLILLPAGYVSRRLAKRRISH